MPYDLYLHYLLLNSSFFIRGSEKCTPNRILSSINLAEPILEWYYRKTHKHTEAGLFRSTYQCFLFIDIDTVFLPKCQTYLSYQNEQKVRFTFWKNRSISSKIVKMSLLVNENHCAIVEMIVENESGSVKCSCRNELTNRRWKTSNPKIECTLYLSFVN